MHGGVCLLYDAWLHGRRIDLPEFSSFEAVCVNIHRDGFHAVVVVVYRPGSKAVTQAFFDEYADIMDRLATRLGSLILIGDFNIHVNVATNDDASKLADILSCYISIQHVDTPTHCQGHTLDLFITP